MKSRYDYMWAGNSVDTDGEVFPDPLSIDYSPVFDDLKTVPEAYTLTQPDLKKLWWALYKATEQTEGDDILLNLNGIDHVGLLEPEDQIILFPTDNVRPFDFCNLVPKTTEELK